MNAEHSSTDVQLSPQGRVVIPASLRKTLKLSAGDHLIVHLEGERIVLERRETIAKRLQARFSNLTNEVSLVDELIAERRADASREDSTA